MTVHDDRLERKSNKRILTVVGIGYKRLDERAGKAVLEADAIFASQRLADVFLGYEEYAAVKDRLQINNSVPGTLSEIKTQFEDVLRIVLLASGDPMFYGIGRKVIEEFSDANVEIIPDLSCVQAAFSLIKKPWDDALLISLHGKGRDVAHSDQRNENQSKLIARMDGGNDPNSNMRSESNIQSGLNARYGKCELSDIPVLLRSNHKIAILTDPKNNPARIAEAIHEAYEDLPNNQVNMFVCEHIGYSDERAVSGTPVELMQIDFADPNVVIVVRGDQPSDDHIHECGTQSGLSRHAQENLLNLTTTDREMQSQIRHSILFGLSEDEIAHERGLITKDEVRAVSIHKLELPATGVLWDIGAGSGSISLEAACLSSRLNVIAIEKNPERIETIKKNRAKYGLENIEVKCGEAPDILRDMPDPDRVFIGGSSGNLTETIKYVKGNTRAGIIVINAVTLDTLNEAVNTMETLGFSVTVVEVSVSKMKMVGGKRFLGAENPVFVIKGKRDALEVKHRI
jgi:precorrin-6Y C5,15-methyltransferase (decarboxylating)